MSWKEEEYIIHYSKSLETVRFCKEQQSINTFGFIKFTDVISNVMVNDISFEWLLTEIAGQIDLPGARSPLQTLDGPVVGNMNAERFVRGREQFQIRSFVDFF